MITIPYPGIKRMWIRDAENICKNFEYHTVFEPFGSSFVLGVNMLNDGLIDRLVVNDPKNFFTLYPTYLDIKDEIVEKCYEQGFRRTTTHYGKNVIVDGDERIPVDTPRLPDEQAKYLQSLIRKIDEKYWPLLCLGYNFAYPSRFTNPKLTDFCYFNRNLSTKEQREYLSVLHKAEIEHLDWYNFLRYHRPEMNEHTLTIYDPPIDEFEFTTDDYQYMLTCMRNLETEALIFGTDKWEMRRAMNRAHVNIYDMYIDEKYPMIHVSW